MFDEYSHHPAAAMFDLMPEDSKEFLALVEDIRVNGLREPIVILYNQIVDGRNRHRACSKAGVEPVFREFDGDIDGDLVTFVISKNLHRRHLSVTERSKIAFKLGKLNHGGDRRSGQSAFMRLDQSRAETAKVMHVSERSVDNAAAVYAKGAPQLVQAFDRGEVPVTRAAGIAQLSKAEQRERLVQLVKDAPRKNREKDRKSKERLARQAPDNVRTEFVRLSSDEREKFDLWRWERISNTVELDDYVERLVSWRERRFGVRRPGDEEPVEEIAEARG
jgi:hypothetical protein